MLEKAENGQDIFKKYLNKIRIGNESQKQMKTLANINMLFSGRNNPIKFFKDYSQWLLKLKIKLIEKDSKYQLLSKCFKNYQ